MKYKDSSCVIFLENTQTIFNGIERLYKHWQAKQHNNTYESVVHQQWNACYPNDKLGHNTDLRYQNPLCLFFEFLKKDPYWKEQDAVDDICRKSAVQMLALYDSVTKLSKDTIKEEVPERFEEFCCRMRDIMQSDMCYLLYSQWDQTELLSNSSYPENMVSQEHEDNGSDNNQLTQAEFDSLRLYIQRARKDDPDFYKGDSKGWQLADTIYVPAMTDLYAKGTEPAARRNLVVLVLDLPVTPETKGKSEWIYIVFQYPQQIPDKEALIRRTRNMLFIRKKILEHCVAHMYLLLMAQRTYHYIPCLNMSENMAGARIRLLHLTDLHLQPGNCDAAMQFAEHIYGLDKSDARGKKQSLLKDPGGSQDKQTPLVDLLAITGDVVQANYSAGLLEQNYALAEKFIRFLAAKLWKTKEGYVRADWQKRIIITPGNHDYASMNELQAEPIPGVKRAVGVGYPARNEGGPMVKFAYYINFINQLFRTDVNMLIHNQLNEVRCYRQLGLTVLSINSVSEAGPLRTNKVLMNPLKGKELIHATDLKNQFPLLLTHHTPNYDIDYLMDRYWTNCGVDFSEQRSWVISFRECLERILKLESVIDAERLREELRSIGEKLKNISTAVIEKASLAPFKPEKCDLLWDIERTKESIAKPPYLNEQVIALCRSILTDEKMSKRDGDLLNLNFRELLSAMHYQLVLGGHTHQLRLGGKDITKETNYSSIDPKHIPFAEGGMFLIPQGDNYIVNLGVLDFDRQSSERQWKVKAHYHPFLFSSGKFQCRPGIDGERSWSFWTERYSKKL